MSILHHPPISTLFPYTTLFRSPRKAILEILPGLAPELQLLLAARLAPARVEGIIKQLGGPDATVMGKPLVFRLTRLLPAADPLLLRALEQADLNCCDPATGRSLLHGFLAPGRVPTETWSTPCSRPASIRPATCRAICCSRLPGSATATRSRRCCARAGLTPTPPMSRA